MFWLCDLYKVGGQTCNGQWRQCTAGFSFEHAKNIENQPYPFFLLWKGGQYHKERWVSI